MRSTLLLVMLMACAASSEAQTSPKLQFEVAGGVSFPVWPEEFPLEFKTGSHGSAGVAYPGNSRLSALLLLEWDSHELNPNGIANIPEIVTSGGRLTIIAGTANIRLNLVQRGSILPYFLAGAGVYRQSSWTEERNPITGSQRRSTYRETAVAIQLGFGLTFPISSWFGVFVDGRYLVGLTKRQSIRSIPIRLGVRL